MAIEGGKPVRNQILPYGHQSVDERDIQAVVKVLRSDWLTTGPMVGEFEKSFSQYIGASSTVSVSSGTAALHASMYAMEIGPGDEVIIPSITFAATASSVVFQGGTPIFIDVEPSVLLIDPGLIEEKITPRTKVVVAVDYAGHPCDYDEICRIANHYGIKVVSDSSHSLGGFYKGRPVGTLADLNTFSFHPVKHITTGEGGMISTNREDFVRQLRIFRNHGISKEHYQRQKELSWFYEIISFLGFWKILRAKLYILVRVTFLYLFQICNSMLSSWGNH